MNSKREASLSWIQSSSCLWLWGKDLMIFLLLLFYFHRFPKNTIMNDSKKFKIGSQNELSDTFDSIGLWIISFLLKYFIIIYYTDEDTRSSWCSRQDKSLNGWIAFLYIQSIAKECFAVKVFQAVLLNPLYRWRCLKSLWCSLWGKISDLISSYMMQTPGKIKGCFQEQINQKPQPNPIQTKWNQQQIMNIQ